jgi:hypothetical protein
VHIIPKNDDKNGNENLDIEEVETFTWTHGERDVGNIFLFEIYFNGDRKRELGQESKPSTSTPNLYVEKQSKGFH